MAPALEISLNPKCSTRHIELVLKYLAHSTELTEQEWSVVLEALDLLRSSRVTYKGGAYSFNGFYTRFIDEKYADSFIKELLRLPGLKSAISVMRIYNERVIEDLVKLGVVDVPSDESRCLAAFCVYWWNSFVKGYIRELTVFQDLEAEEIQFIKHDIGIREERMSPSDLLLLGFRGDIKTSTYFLLVARSYPLSCDFYITRLFNKVSRTWWDIVIMTIAMWEKIDGETKSSTFINIENILPAAVSVTLFGQTLVIVDYTVWKTKIRARQSIE